LGAITTDTRLISPDFHHTSGIKLCMDLEELYGASFVDWQAVASSWAKRTVGSRLLLFAARRYLATSCAAPLERDERRTEVVEPTTLPEEIKAAFIAPPTPESPAMQPWGEFVDAAVAAELEVIPYGERPVLLGELRAGLGKAAEEAGPHTTLGRWFVARRDALPGEDLPENPEYLPV
jgi:hypothetical protein